MCTNRMRLAAALMLAAGTSVSAQTLSLTTTFQGGNGQAGAMFDLTAHNTLTLSGFDYALFSGGGPGVFQEIEVYYVTGRTSFVGLESDPSAWTLLGTMQVETVAAPAPINVPIGGLTIAAGETIGIYFTRTSTLSTSSIAYTNGPLGAFSNADLTFEDRGVGKAYPFGSTFDPRIWNGTIYYELGGTITVGACCLPDGSCSEITEPACTSQGGIYQGNNTECATTVCPKGACCLADGSCVEVAESGCTAQNGTYHGDGTDCATTPTGGCPQPPTGACCLADGSCVTEWEGGCIAMGGLYQGDNTDCATASCPTRLDSHWGVSATQTSGSGAGAYFLVEATDPQGIIIDGFHIDTPAAANTQIDAHVYFRPNTFVGFHNDPSEWILLGEVQTTAAGPGNPTIVPVGGLHIGGGETWALRVGSSNGVRYTSSTNTTAIISDASVSLHMGEVQSTFFGATTFGTYPTNLRGWIGSMFYHVGATITTGACCMPDGSCSEVREVICTGQGGTYHGDNTDCATTPPGGCPQPGACCIPLGCTEVQESECATLGGTFEGQGIACPGNCPVPQFVVVPNAHANLAGTSGLNTVLRDQPRVYQLAMAESELMSVPHGSLITGATWRIGATASYTTWPDVPANWNRFDVQVSTSVNPPGSLSTTFDDNIAPDVVMGRSGPLTIPPMTFPGGSASPTPNDFGFVIEFDTPFEYQGGDLLLTIRHEGNDTGTTRFMDSIASSTTAQAMSAIGDANAVTGSGSSFSITLLTIDDGVPPCYADCNNDGELNISDFLCFIDEFAVAQTLPPAQQETHYANCTGATSEPFLTVADFLCFIDEFAQGCP